MKKLIVSFLYCLFFGIVAQAQCDNNITLESQAEVDAFNVNYNCGFIEGDLVINNTNVTNLDSLFNVQEITGNLVIYNNDSLVSFAGLEKLKTIGGNFSIGFNPLITDFDDLESLTDIGGNIAIQANASLTSLQALNAITHVTGNIAINRHKNLISLEGLENIQSIGGNLVVKEDSSLTNLMGLESLISIGNSLIIDNNLVLTNLEGLSSVKDVMGKVIIKNTDTLQSLSGLENLQSIGSDLIFEEIHALDFSISGLSSLETIGGNATFDLISSFSSDNNLESLKTVGGYVTFDQVNGNFTLDWTSLESIGLSFRIEESGISNLQGFNNLLSVGGVFVIEANNTLENIEGFNSLNTIDSYLTIEENPLLEKIEGFSDLILVDGSFYIIDNDLLTSIEGFESLEVITSWLEVTNNPNLSNCCVIATFINVPYTTSSIYGNANGCSSVSQIIDNCEGSQLCQGSIVLNSQAEVDAFPSNHDCRIIFGNLTINGTNITNLDSLYTLEQVNGTFILSNNEALENVDGLINLQIVKFNFEIENNDALLNLDGLYGLTNVGDDFIIKDIDSPIFNIDGLSTIRAVWENLRLIDIPNLSNTIGFESLFKIEESVVIENVFGDYTLDFNALYDIDDSIVIKNTSLTAIEGFNSLIGDIGKIKILNNNNLELLDGFEQFNYGNVEIKNNPNLEECCVIVPWENKPYIDVILENNDDECNSFVAASIHCEGICSSPLTLSTQAEVDAFPSNYGCHTVDGNLIIEGDDIVNIDSLIGVTNIINGGLFIRNNPNIISIEGIQNLVAAEKVFVQNNDLLTTVNSFENLTEVFQLRISDNDNLINIEPFLNLQELSFCLITGNESLVEINEIVPNVPELNLLRINDNASLTTINGFNNISEFKLITNFSGSTGFMEIANNPTLQTMIVFNSIFYIHEVSILNNPNLENLMSFGNLEKAKYISIEETGINNLETLGTLEDLYSLKINNNPNLTDINKIGFIEGIQNIEITNNSQLSECCVLLLNDGNRIVEANAPNCSSIEEIETICGEDICPIEAGCFRTDFTLFLEGAYQGNQEMATNLSEQIPLEQPYHISPYFYNGDEKLESIPENMVDWILVEVREGTPNVSGEQGTLPIQTKAALLLEDGSVVGTDENALKFFDLVEGTGYYICIRHRNHLDVLASKDVEADELMMYDFTTDSQGIWGNNQVKQHTDGSFMLHTGDYTGDGIIQLSDYDAWKENPAQLEVYAPTDGTLDGVVQITDYDAWFDNKAKIGSIEVALDPNDIPEENCYIYGMHYDAEIDENFLSIINLEESMIEPIDSVSNAFTYQVGGFGYVALNTPPIIYQGDYYLMNDNNNLYQLDVETGEILDEVIIDTNVGQMMLNPSDGLIYGVEYIFQTNERYLVNIDPQSGVVTRISENPYDFFYTINTQAIIWNDVYYVMDENNEDLYNFDMTTGEIIDTTHFDVNVGQLVVNPNDGQAYGIEYNFQPNERWLVTLNPETGEVTRLTTNALDFSYSGASPAVILDNKYYLIVSGEGIYEFDVTTGEVTNIIEYTWGFGAMQAGCNE